MKPLALPRCSRGLTLIEIAIALAVLAILGAIALPSLGARLEHQRLNTAAQALATDLAEARFEAARRGQPLHLRTTPGEPWCWAVSVHPDCPCGGANACQLRNVMSQDHAGVRLAQASNVQFDPAGTGNAQTVAVLETRRGDRLRVELAPTGRARVCALAGAWPQLPPCAP
jgi:type IV fimbrial biogenesis protein FimT